MECDEAGIAFSMFHVDRLEEGGVQGWAGGLPANEVVRRSRRVVAIAAVDEPQTFEGGFSVRIHVETEPTLRLV